MNTACALTVDRSSDAVDATRATGSASLDDDAPAAGDVVASVLRASVRGGWVIREWATA